MGSRRPYIAYSRADNGYFTVCVRAVSQLQIISKH